LSGIRFNVPGCNLGVLLRLGVGHEKRQGFFYVCPWRQAATRGALIWEDGASTKLELEDGRQLETDEECPEVVTINPELPALATTRSMAEPGGSAFITFFGWLGPDGIQQYQSAFYRMRHLIENDWKGLARLTTYYLNRNWNLFDQALEPLLPEEARDISAIWKRDHHIHFLYELFFGPLWAAHPGKYFLEMKTAWNPLWSPDRAHFNEMVYACVPRRALRFLHRAALCSSAGRHDSRGDRARAQSEGWAQNWAQ
jgi:hypothetical protein